MIELVTERLLLRPQIADDLEWLAVLRGHADVMRYIGASGAVPLEQTRERLDRYLACWVTHGLGMFSVRDGQDAAPVGWAGLQPLEGTAEIEVGYAFGPPAWGRGFATEAARAVVRWGFEERSLERIVAVASPENGASRHVMDKLGMRYEGTRLVHGMDSVYYAVTPQDFARALPRGVPSR
jgi:ribosomal-protein-alanine N-acetyltransferase